MQNTMMELSTSEPQGLDEAAEEYGKRQGVEDKPYATKHFRAGAKWMAAQGVTVKATVFKQSDGGYFANGTAYLEEAYNMKRALSAFNSGDEVIVQIRKKEEQK